LRVLLVAHQYPPDGLAGVEGYTHSLAGGLAEAGDAVAVVARRLQPTPFEPELRRERTASGVVYRITGGSVSLDDPMLHAHRLERLLTTVLAEHAPDVLQVNHLVGMPLRLPLIARRLRIPVVLSLLDFYVACPLEYLRKRSGALCAGPDGGRECVRTCFAGQPGADRRWPARNELFRGFLSLADRVLCPSHFVADYFREHVPKARIDEVPLGVDVPRAVRDAVREQGRRELQLAYVGAVAPHKGVHIIVEAAAASGVAARITVHGQVYDPAYADALGAAAAGSSTRVDVRGPFRREDLPALLSDADAVVLPSQVPEVYPLALREALALGVPVLAGRLGGLAEAVVEGVNGITFEATDPGNLRDVIVRLDGDRGLLERLRRGARATRVPTVAEHVQRLRTLYAELSAGERAAKPALLERLERRYDRLTATSVGTGQLSEH